MRIFARKYPYSRLTDRMDVVEKQDAARISGGLQLMIALEALPYFTTVVITSILVSYVLNHPELQWTDVFTWRSASFAGFTFMILSTANYGDRVMNGRFFLFLIFTVLSLICMASVFFVEKEVAILVFACCIQPVLILRDASRLCYIVQILQARDRSPKIRLLCFFLFLMANLGAFLSIASTSQSMAHNQVRVWVCMACLATYTLLSVLVFIFGGSFITHRNIVERGFRCAVWKFANLMRKIMRKLCSMCCKKRWQDKEYRSIVDEEIDTCVDCMLKMSATLFPLLLYFATTEMTFFTWVWDYDIFVDLGFHDWPMSLVDVYHGFNVASVLVIYVLIIPVVQCFTHVPDVVILCLSYFALCLSWVTAACLQYSNELRQPHHLIANESQIIVFSSTLEPVLLDASWSDKKWLNSGDFSINYLRLNSTNMLDPIRSEASIWKDKTPFPSSAFPLTKKDIQLQLTPSFLVHINKTECYLLVEDTGDLQKKPLRGLNAVFELRGERRDHLNGTLLTLCSTNLYASNASHYLVIQGLQTKTIQTELVCKHGNYDAVTNLTVGWYELYLREGDQFVPFQMQLNIRKGGVHYLYISKGNDTFAPYVGNLTNIVEPHFVVEKVYILMQIGLFSFAYSMGMVALLSFVIGASPKHLLEFGFAILFTCRAVGSGVAAVFLPSVISNSRGMFTWVIAMIAGLLLMVRNAWVYLATGGQCGPEVKTTGEELEPESSESSSEDEDDKPDGESPKTDTAKPEPIKTTIQQAPEPTRPTNQQAPEPPEEAPTTSPHHNRSKSWFPRRTDSSPSVPPRAKSPQNTKRFDAPAPATDKKDLQPQPSDLENVSSWFSRKPKPNRSLGRDEPGPLTPVASENESHSKNKSEK